MRNAVQNENDGLNQYHVENLSSRLKTFRQGRKPFVDVENLSSRSKTFRRGRKPFVEVENLSSRSKTYEIWSKWIGSGGIPKNSKSKTPCADSNLGPRCEGSEKTKSLPTLGPRVEARNETRNPPCGGGGVYVGGILRL
ncbi:hypothetical protein AVEN_124390-1 [Araneus ventricosus]|uniref:Uncharacterized protein n=1 Tax=Araneus ventricosus TaxID=182803 RepID=A0A4Y2XC23_ARAVE|nr:hypothetical protein AVEN_269796-1 [Araneus ventricosus]GBO46786.1 hypothetical protein AVEN_59826-1 [Araneus ventricosus]GBO46787.1 hypothetical protein AVEN_61576-1 [Araneus ventricosus]GBO46789.1 hypothetical protein AVEN_124390-1 [Araneus ventricosus]